MHATAIRTPGRLLTWAIVLVAAGIAGAGWQRTWFLTDDAFIAFRYVGNAHAGLGLVWNPPPFLPVEGYSSLLWVLSLWAIWEVGGWQPPEASNWLSLLCGLGTLLVVARAVLRPAVAAFGRWGMAIGGLALLALATNRTFVTWLSSGLETAMFGLFAVWWTVLAARTTNATSRSLFGLALLAALATLTRPDGVLFALATALLAASWLPGLGWQRAVAATTPLLLPAAHFAWRWSFYGEWLPNTYYAKVMEAWPESGLRYLFCFVLEHGVWLWLGLVAWFLAMSLRPLASLRARLVAARGPVVAIGVWIAFVGYYTLVVGGDHFEYRPFAPLVPLCLVTGVVIVARTCRRWWAAGSWMLLLGIATSGPGVFVDRELAATGSPWIATAASRVPTFVRPVVRAWERNQAWLWLHLVGLRRELHAAFCAGKLDGYPGRDFTFAGPPGDLPVMTVINAGVIPWALPNVAVLDGVGLNDWVIARTPSARAPVPQDGPIASSFAVFDRDHDGRIGAAELADTLHAVQSFRPGNDVASHVRALLVLCDEAGDGLDAAEFVAAARALHFPRQMAHERTPPAGYLEAFRPNVVFADGALRIVPRAVPLTDEEIVRIEQRWRADRR